MCDKKTMELLLDHLWNLPEAEGWKKDAFMRSLNKENTALTYEIKRWAQDNVGCRPLENIKLMACE